MSLLQEMQQHGLADCEFNRSLKENEMSILNTDTLDNGAVVVNVGEDGGYVMVEDIKDGWIQVTVFDDAGDVLFEGDFDTVSHPEVKLREV